MRRAGAAIGYTLSVLAACPVWAQSGHEPTHASVTTVAVVRTVAQPVVAAVSGGSVSAAGHLTLRPSPGLEALTIKVARVLSLRFGSGAVEVGDPPPPGLLEAVPAGHLALGTEGGRVRLVLGAAFGTFFEASVLLSPRSAEPDVRSLALAVEALRDRALEAWERSARDAPDATTASAASRPPTAASLRASPERVQLGGADRAAARDRGAFFNAQDSEVHREVEPMLYVRVYGGASLVSSGLRMGAATGGGLCVEGHCLVLGIETPLPFGPEASPTDVRYRYPTFTSGFYSRPWQFGAFAPAASVGFLSRVGYFRRDMGMDDGESGLDTDLGVRGTLEASVQVVGSVELTSELGVDYALDRWRLGTGDSFAYRGARSTLWAQCGVRVRPY